jgi:FkbM family methyltransferase
MKNIVEILDVFSETISTKKIILWGAGPNVQHVVNLLTSLNLAESIVGIFDSTRELDSDQFCGIKIIEHDEVRKMSYDNNIIVACAGLNELYGYIVPEHLFYFRIIHRRALEFYCQINQEILHDFQNNIDLFTDDISKILYENRIRLVLSSVMFDSMFKSSGGPYFANDIVPSLGAGKWLYAGAYNGRHLDRAIEFRSDQEILAVEPSAKMFNFLKDKYGGGSKVDLHNYLLWSSSGQKMRFNDDSQHQGLAASIHQHEEFGDDSYVETITIDDLVGSNHVSQIALDVEGSEQYAISGAKNTIQKSSPTCAVCLYHNLDDYVRLPGLVKSLTGSKYLAVRQHSCIPFIENVLYAYNQ